MKCPRCQQESPSDADFCPECGAKLAAVCVACGTANAPAHKFCKFRRLSDGEAASLIEETFRYVAIPLGSFWVTPLPGKGRISGEARKAFQAWAKMGALKITSRFGPTGENIDVTPGPRAADVAVVPVQDDRLRVDCGKSTVTKFVRNEGFTAQGSDWRLLMYTYTFARTPLCEEARR
jgi:hypothetical protein